MAVHLVTFKALADFPASLDAHIRSFPAGDEGDGASASDGMTSFRAVLEQCHAFETEYFQPALAKMLEGKHAALDPAPEMFVVQDHGQAQDVLLDLEKARKRALSVLEGLTPDQWASSLKMGETTLTIVGLCHLVCARDFRTLAALQDLLGNANAA